MPNQDPQKTNFQKTSTKDKHQKKKSCTPLGEINPAIATFTGRQGRAMQNAKVELKTSASVFELPIPAKHSRAVPRNRPPKINPDEQNVAGMIAHIKWAITSGGVDGEFSPHPDTCRAAAGLTDNRRIVCSEINLTVIERLNQALVSVRGTSIPPRLPKRVPMQFGFNALLERAYFVERLFPLAGDNVASLRAFDST